MFHGTARQRKAQRLQSYVERRLARQEGDWRKVAQWLAKFYDEKLYEELDFYSFHAWSESIHIGKSLAYDLVAIEKSPHKAMLQTLRVSTARLLLPKLPELDTTGVADLVNDLSELTWHDARQFLYGGDPFPTVVVVACPACGVLLRSSKSVTLEIGHGAAV